MDNNLQTTMTAAKRSLLQNYKPLLTLALTERYAKADDIAPYLGSNPYDFRHACLDRQDQGGFPIFATGKDRPTVKIPIVPFLRWITDIPVSTIYEAIELVAAGAAA